MAEGMPLSEYKEQIIEFSEIYQFCKEFGTTPDTIKKWKEEEPYEFMCFRSFFSGMANGTKEQEIKANGTSNNRRTSRP